MTLGNVVISQCKEVKTMSKYTTGEMAKLCDVSVRTVQYYDSRKLLVPSELSEGGRRLYSEDDLRKLKLNKIAARWPAKAMAQFFLFLQK